MTKDNEEFLRATPSLDSDHSTIVEVVERITTGASDEVERAVRIHDFVRDEVAFGWVPAFDAQTASETLASRIGFCNTKTPLFVTLLRASGIPARVHFAGIDSHILDGMIDPRDRYIDHAYAEVFLDGKWLKVDSHIVDLPLYRAAMAKLRASGKKIGFGVHVNGSATWDGRSDSFAQFLDDGSSPSFSDADFGVHADVPAFYASGRARTPRNQIFRRVILRMLLWFGNRKVRALRIAREGA